jgi:suppressor of ftsI
MASGAMSRPLLLIFSTALAALAVSRPAAAQTAVAPPAQPGAAAPTAFREPAALSSRAGVLSLTLTAARSSIMIGDQPAVAEVYDGSYTPPTLRVHPGDAIRLRLVNRLDEPTNLHMHGLRVGPGGVSDNVFLTVLPGHSQDYEFHIPANHPPGLFWYHPHEHHFSNEQVRNGMAGALIVEGLLDPFPALRGLKERTLLLKDIQLQDGRVANLGIGVHASRTVNGLVDPTLVMRPGETELWRIGNLGANLYYRLRLDGHRFFQVARDGNRLARIVPADELFLPPGGRIEVLVQGGTRGTFRFRTLAVNTGRGGDRYAGAALATLRVEGRAVPERTLPTTLLPVKDLRGSVTGRRTVVFSEGKGRAATYS